MAAQDFIITRKRKKYKFARFAELTHCYEADKWLDSADRRHFLAAPQRVVELGAGSGLFLVEQAMRQPDWFFVAIDVKADRLYTGARYAQQAGIPNIAFIRMHAEQLVEVIGPAAADELWLTFADPFPKKRQAKHRMTHPRFLAGYRQVLKPGGVLHLKTDSRPLFEWSLEQFVADTWHVRQLTYDLHASQLPERYKVMTTYERRFHAMGLPIYAADMVAECASC